MRNRRAFLKAAAVGLAATSCATLRDGRTLVNDVHTRLNPTWVDNVVEVRSLTGMQRVVQRSAEANRKIMVSGGRHAAGGQQFRTDNWLVDTRPMNRVLSFDKQRGLMEVEAGIQWRDLLAYLLRNQGEANAWTFAQKQTGTDSLTLGGAVGSNIHGRALAMQPFISNIESFVLIDAAGEVRRCSRTENTELFKLAIGGYGLFGMVYSVTLRLIPRTKVERVVDVFNVEELIPRLQHKLTNGFTYGDFQFAIDAGSDDFLRKGVFSCYQPVAASEKIVKGRPLRLKDWRELICEAHTHPTQAFEKYAAYYKSTSGQVYWADTTQFSRYADNYHEVIDSRLKEPFSTEVITELYVPRKALSQFMADSRKLLRKLQSQVIYGTIRFIEKDNESFLAWAKDHYACIIFNLHTEHSPAGIEESKAALRGLIDLAKDAGGSFYLTYHRYATREQLRACYPQFGEFLTRKKQYDPEERFESDWYRHCRALIG